MAVGGAAAAGAMEKKGWGGGIRLADEGARPGADARGRRKKVGTHFCLHFILFRSILGSCLCVATGSGRFIVASMYSLKMNH
jgi:hypothetical protein